jgi:hypothetical protein
MKDVVGVDDRVGKPKDRPKRTTAEAPIARHEFPRQDL